MTKTERGRRRWTMLSIYVGAFAVLLVCSGLAMHVYKLRNDYASAHETLRAVVRGQSDVAQAVRQLGGSDKAAQKLDVYITYSGEEAEHHAAFCVLREMGKKAVPPLISGLKSSSSQKRLYAAQTLKDLGQDAARAVPALIECLDDESWEVRLAALGALRVSRVPLASNRVVECLGDDNPRVRASCARLLGTLGAVEAQDSLSALATDSRETPDVRQAAREALEKIKKAQEKEKQSTVPLPEIPD